MNGKKTFAFVCCSHRFGRPPGEISHSPSFEVYSWKTLHPAPPFICARTPKHLNMNVPNRHGGLSGRGPGLKWDLAQDFTLRGCQIHQFKLQLCTFRLELRNSLVCYINYSAKHDLPAGASW